MKIICSKCGHSQEYTIRNPKKIPKYPHKKCTNCSKNIAIKRTKLIDFDNSHKFPFMKLCREKVPYLKKKVKHSKEKWRTLDKWDFRDKKFPLNENYGNFKILELLSKGMYAEEISQKYSVSKVKLSRIITFFKKRNIIEQIRSYPKMFQLTKIGVLILEQGDLSQTKIQEFITGKEHLRERRPPVRAHLDRFKNDLIQKPSWLSSIRNIQKRNGLTIKRVSLNNWDKFIVYFNYQDFNGLDNIEICKRVIIYNFRKKLEEQLVASKEEVVEHKKDLILNCKQARSFLQEKGFSIGQEEPIRCQKPHYGISSKDPRHIGQLGKELLMTIKTDNGSIIIDDSPGVDGEEETDNEEKVISYFELPDELEKVKEDVNEIKEKIDQIVDNTGDKTQKSEILELKEKISDLESSMSRMADGMEKIVDTFSKLTDQSKQETTTPTESEGMYQ